MVVKAGLTYAKSLTSKQKFYHSIQVYKVLINLLQYCIDSYAQILRNSDDTEADEINI